MKGHNISNVLKKNCLSLLLCEVNRMKKKQTHLSIIYLIANSLNMPHKKHRLEEKIQMWHNYIFIRNVIQIQLYGQVESKKVGQYTMKILIKKKECLYQYLVKYTSEEKKIARNKGRLHTDQRINQARNHDNYTFV